MGFFHDVPCDVMGCSESTPKGQDVLHIQCESRIDTKGSIVCELNMLMVVPINQVVDKRTVMIHNYVYRTYYRCTHETKR